MGDSSPQRGDEPQMYSLTWKTHSSVSGKKFFQHFQDDLYTDCQVSCGDKVTPCHRLVLSSSSSFFERIFKENQQTLRPLVILKDVDPELFLLMVEYMYTGQVLVPSGCLQRFLILAAELRVEGLMDPTKDAEMDYPPSPKATVYDNRPQEEPNHFVVDPQADENEEKQRIAAAASLVSMSPKTAKTFPDQSVHTQANNNNEKVSSKATAEPTARARKAFHPKRIRLENLCGALGSRPKTASPSHVRDVNSPGTESTGSRSIRSAEDVEQLAGIEERYRHGSGPRNGPTKDAFLTQQGELLLKMQNGRLGKGNEPEPSATITSGAYSALGSGLDPALVSKLLSEQMELIRKQSGSSASLTAALGAAMNLDLSQRVREHFLNNFPNDIGNQTAPAAAHGYAGFENGTSSPNDIQRQSKKRGRTPGNGGKPKPSASLALDDVGNPIYGPNGKPMVRCEDCGKLLADPSSLYRHRKIHTGDKPHTCDICHRVFIQRYNMKQHVKTHIGEDVNPAIIEGLEEDIRRVFLGLEGVADEDEVNRRLARKNKKRQQQQAKEVLHQQRSHQQLQYQQHMLQQLQDAAASLSPTHSVAESELMN